MAKDWQLAGDEQGIMVSVWARDIAATCTAKNQPPSNVWAKEVLGVYPIYI